LLPVLVIIKYDAGQSQVSEPTSMALQKCHKVLKVVGSDREAAQLEMRQVLQLIVPEEQRHRLMIQISLGVPRSPLNS
jgi:polynucleotide 5'-kinase involved in rRNA processing